jgi:hypothetical protein
MFRVLYIALLCILERAEALKSITSEITGGRCKHYSLVNAVCTLDTMLPFVVRYARCEDVCWYREWYAICDDDSECKRITYGFNDNADTFEDCCPEKPSEDQAMI